MNVQFLEAAKQNLIRELFTAFYGLLDDALRLADDAILVDADTTAHEALVRLAGRYDAAVAAELEARLRREGGEG